MSSNQKPRSLYTLKECNQLMLESDDPNITASSDVTIKVTPRTSASNQPRTPASNQPPTPSIDDKETTYKVHKYMLQSRCPKLNAQGNDAIELTEISATAVKQLLKFLYYEDIDLSKLEKEQIYDLLALTNKYDVALLNKECVGHIKKQLISQHVCEILDHSMKLNQEDLISACCEHIGRSTRTVLRSEDFLRATVKVVEKIASLHALAVPEIDLFLALVAWARRNNDKGNAQISGTDLRDTLSPVIVEKKLVRFPVMSVGEFHESVIPLKVLDNEEVVEVLDYLLSKPNGKEKRKTTRFPEEPRFKDASGASRKT